VRFSVVHVSPNSPTAALINVHVFCNYRFNPRINEGLSLLVFGCTLIGVPVPLGPLAKQQFLYPMPKFLVCCVYNFTM